MSEDRKGFDAGDYNLFRYCHNDPIDFTDPMGLQEAENARDAMAHWADSGNNFQGSFARFTAKQGLSMGQTKEQKGPSLEGTNRNMAIPSKLYDTAKAAGKPGSDAEYAVAKKDDRTHERTGPIGQVDGANNGGYFRGPAEVGPGVWKKGKHAGDQVSYIDDLTQRLPPGSHLVGYYTVHIFYDENRLKTIDAPIFRDYWKVDPVITVKSPGFYQNWDQPKTFSYP